MIKRSSNKRRLKYVFVALACTAAFSLTGLAAACKPDKPDNEDEKTTSKEDTQLLKNGNFEFFNVPDDGVYLVNTPNNWTRGGSSSYTQSGIIGTSQKDWAALTDSGLAAKLDYNNALDSSDKDYKDKHVDYNGLKSSDLLYKDTYAALNTKDDAEEADKTAVKEFIENPGTHYNVREKDGGLVYTDDEGNEKPVYEDKDENSKTYGDYFFDEELKQPFSHVLMVHNYATSHNGIAQNYSSVSIDLPANTAAEISVWVKTAYLKFSQGADVSQDRGANITVKHTVGSSTLDNFSITSINTEKLIKDGKASADYNGWVQYSVYVNACDFTSSNITLELGLGESNLRDVNYPVEGYAFFDDVSVTKYVSLDDSENYKNDEQKIKNDKTNLTLSSDKSEKVFVADTDVRNNTAIDQRHANSFSYLIDLASEQDYNAVSFSNATAGLTVDKDGYTTSLYTLGEKNLMGFTTATATNDAKLPKNFNSFSLTGDLLAYFKAGYEFTAADTEFNARLNEALKSAADLPKLDAATDDNVLLMLSANRAAYTSSVDLTIAKESRTIVSFWLKTSDMKGSTAATVTATDKGDKDNTATFTLDSTGMTTDVGDEENKKDIFNGWVQCFVFIDNETESEKTVSLDLSIGQTVIKDTDAAKYKAGWVSMANLQTLSVDEKTFSYTGEGDHTATLTLGEDKDKETNAFDEVYGNQIHRIENDFANPANYTGVNGGSSYVKNNGQISMPFDDSNTNGNAGLINKKYFENYKNNEWFDDLLNSFGLSGNTDYNAVWNNIFGSKSVQPLVIVNKTRDSFVIAKNVTEENFKNYYLKNDNNEFENVAADAEFDKDATYFEKVKVKNYGFLGSEQTVAADSYATVSVKVKVSKGAVAYVYLTDTSASKEVLTFKAPSYTFYYDQDGNVLKKKPEKDPTLTEQLENILYTLRDDGLYQDANGKLYANVYNYAKLYKDASAQYFDKDKNPVGFNNLVKGQTYYKADGTEANGYLVTDDGTKIYEYKDGKYYYVMKDVKPVEVNPFDTSYAIKGYSDISETYVAKIEGNEENANKWITLNFVLHAGSASKSYRLELWSGERQSLDSGSAENSTVIFDYSYSTVSDDTLKNDYYEKKIISAYQELLTSKGLLSGFATLTENISYYKELTDKYLASGELTQSDIDKYEILTNYVAHYYTYSLYDSANFKPFNKETADENSTGYDYDISKYSEKLAYLQISEGDTYTVFADYSVIDQSISLGEDSDTGDGDNDKPKGNNTTVWLLVSSILLVVALVVAMMSLLIRDMLKKKRREKAIGKNNFNHQKANRYMKKLHLKKEEFEEVDISDDEEQPVATEETQNPEAETVETEEPEQPTESDEIPEENNSDNGEEE